MHDVQVFTDVMQVKHGAAHSMHAFYIGTWVDGQFYRHCESRDSVPEGQDVQLFGEEEQVKQLAEHSEHVLLLSYIPLGQFGTQVAYNSTYPTLQR